MTRVWFPALCTFSLVVALALPVSGEPKLASVPGASDLLLGPAKPPQVVRDGRMQVQHTQLDIGKPSDLFDGKYETVIRTPSINPAFFEFVLAEPVSFYGIRLATIAEKHDFVLAAAANSEDLQAKRGSYRVLARGRTDMTGDVIYAGREPVTFSAFRVDLKRLTGDDYVHLSEWEFLEPVSIKTVQVDYKIRTNHGDEPAIYKPLDENASRPAGSLLILRVKATKADGETFDATSAARIKCGSRYARTWRGGPSLELTKPGTVAVSVQVGTVTVHGKVQVAPRKLANRQMDLDALYVERLPRINFDAPNGGWPKPGQQVIWRAHVQNWGERTVTPGYRWTLDGCEVASGAVRIRAGETATVDLPWTWEQKRHEIAFEVDPDDKIPEPVGHNNRVEFETDALAVGFYIDRSFADIHHEYQYQLGLDDANSFADYAQRQIRHWNKMLRRARFPEAPEGALDRVRLDEVLVVPDQAVPFQGGDWPTNFPNLEDKSVDLIWGFPYKLDYFEKPIDIEGIKKQIAEGRTNGHYFFLDLALIHELNHARYLVDSYGFDVHVGATDPEKSNIRIKDDQGRWIVGLYLQKEGIVHWNHYEGDMGGGYEQYGPYEVVMLNRVAGQRAQGGNTNGTSRCGAYLQDIPKQFRIKFVGPKGEVLANDPVKLYWAAPQEGWYGKLYDNEADRQYQTDADGAITVDPTFFSKDGKIIHTWGHSNAVPIVRIDHQGKTYYVFLEVSEVNMLANTSKDPIPTLVEEIPLRDGEPTPLPADYRRVGVPDWRLRTAWEPPK